jgi:hypothetical protein
VAAGSAVVLVVAAAWEVGVVLVAGALAGVPLQPVDARRTRVRRKASAGFMGDSCGFGFRCGAMGDVYTCDAWLG